MLYRYFDPFETKRGKIMSEEKKRKAIYNPEADKKWRESNKERRNYLTDRTSTRRFLKTKATLEDLEEIKKLVEERENALNSI